MHLSHVLEGTYSLKTLVNLTLPTAAQNLKDQKKLENKKKHAQYVNFPYKF